jgi:hypothetical protein
VFPVKVQKLQKPQTYSKLLLASGLSFWLHYGVQAADEDEDTFCFLTATGPARLQS